MTIQINVSLSADPALLTALQALSAGKSPSTLTSLAATPAVIKIEDKTTAKATKEKAGKIAESVAPSQDTGANGTLSQDATGAAPSAHSLSSLRAIAVPLSKAGHKDAIKGWLSKAGYESIQNLEEKNFNGFYDFLQTLKS